jgi:hypothetical protein
MKRRIIISIGFWVISALIPQGLYAFENQKTHPAITERAAIAFTIDGYLKAQLGLNDGINT